MIGSNLIKSLNRIGIKDILVVDNLENGKKIKNLSDLDFIDYIDKNDFINSIIKGYRYNNVEAIFHQGACSSTTNWDGKYIMKNNFEYTKLLLKWCQENKAQFIFASSASVYGLGENGFSCKRESEHPINMYAFSKFQFDQYFRAIQHKLKTQVVSLRYFNVYGPREEHKKTMASTIFHFNNQILESKKCRLFEGIDGFENGEQKRDFVFVEDIASVNIWFLKNPNISGIFNVGTGKEKSFNEVAKTVINWHKIKQPNEIFSIEYIKFPDHLKGSYQNFTKADISQLRDVGCKLKFDDISSGIFKYLDWLNN